MSRASPEDSSNRSAALRAFNPRLQLETLYRLDAQGQITSTREPNPSRGPTFALIRSTTQVAWAVRAGMPPDVVDTLAELVADEPPLHAPGDDPRHVAEYLAALGGRAVSGPAFTFPDPVADLSREQADVILVDELAAISRHFSGWSQEEVRARQPILGFLEDGHAVCLCFCARRSEAAAEAGVETAGPYRGRGLAPPAAAAWATAVRAEGLVPIYSTQWTNTASLAVARKLKLETIAKDWTIVDL